MIMILFFIKLTMIWQPLRCIKISLDFLGEDKLGQVYNTIQNNSNNIDEYTGYFYKTQGTCWLDPGAFVNRGKIEKLTADFIGNEL